MLYPLFACVIKAASISCIPGDMGRLCTKCKNLVKTYERLRSCFLKYKLIVFAGR